jgi:alginate O-acetyltransferase complex protein AlgJ
MSATPSIDRHSRFAAAAVIAVLALGLWQVGTALTRIDFHAIPSSLDDFRTGRTTAGWQHAIENELPWREGMIATASGLRYALARGSREEVRVGRDGWLFLGEELQLNPDSPALAKRRLALVGEANRALKERGILLVVALVPDKSRVYSRYVAASDVPPQHAARYVDALRGLRSQGVETVDLLTPLANAAREAQVYYRTDTHWNQRGATIAAEAIAASVRSHAVQLAPSEFRTREGSESERAGDLIRLMGLEYAPAWLRPAADRERPAKTEEIDGSAGASLLGDYEIPATLVGTSYSMRANFHGFLQQALGARVLNAARDGSGFFQSANEYFRDEAFRASPPKVVIWEIPERVLSEKAATPEALPFGGTRAPAPR